MLEDVSDGKEDIGMAAAADDDSDDGAGNDSVKWLLLLLPKRFSDSTSIGLFDVTVAFPFGFLESSGNAEKGIFIFLFEREVKHKDHVPGLDEIGQIMN